MPFTLAILATILSYTWILQPRGVPVAVPGIVVAAIAAWNGVRTGVWGLSTSALWSASRAAFFFTVPAVAIVLAVGLAFGTLHDRGSSVRELLILIPWGGAQQWVLHRLHPLRGGCAAGGEQ